MAGRNLVIDPKTTAVGPSLYISEPVTTEKNWTTSAASGTFGAGGNWSGGLAPDLLNRGIANVRHVSGGNQTAVVASNAVVWELNVSGTANQSMTVNVQSGVKLTTFAGINIEQGALSNCKAANLDAQYVEILGGTSAGAGTITTGSGPIPGQVENRGGTIRAGQRHRRRWRSSAGSPMGQRPRWQSSLAALQLVQFDKISVTGGVALDGTLAVSLVEPIHAEALAIRLRSSRRQMNSAARFRSAPSCPMA